MAFFASLFKLSLIFQVFWNNTTINIPLNEPVDQYVIMPEASLYKDDQKITTEVNYLRGTNHTFISVINSKYVRTYHIYYEAYFPLYNVQSRTLVTFNIVDDIPPEIDVDKVIQMPLGEKIIDFKKIIKVSDNYDSESNIDLFIDSSKVNIHVVGTYEVIIRATDQSKNTTTKIVQYEIYDHIAPVITITKPLTIEVHQKLDIHSFLSVKDNYDKNVELTVDTRFVDFMKLGTYPLFIYAIDASKNTTIVETTITIVDTTKPIIQLKSNIEPINYLEEITDELLYSYLLEFKDNYDNLTFGDFMITHDIDTKRLGTYTINYRLKDFSNNEAVSILKIQVKDLEKPVIEPISTLSIRVHEVIVDFDLYFNIYDNYDAKDQLNIKRSGKVDTSTIGIYKLEYEVTDTNKNTTKAVYYFEVYDDIKPEILQLKALKIDVDSHFNMYEYFDFIDNYDDELVIFLFDENVQYDKIGNYPINIAVYDSSMNEAIYNGVIEIFDAIEPTIKLSKQSIYLTLGMQVVDYKSYIQDVFDNHSDLNTSQVNIYEDVNYEKIGKYFVNYEIYDDAHNLGKAILTVYIDYPYQKMALVEDISIEQGIPINFLEYVDIIDSHAKVSYDASHVDINTPGIYYVTYYFTNPRGISEAYVQRIEINEMKDFNLLNYTIPLIIIGIGIFLCVFIVKKDKSF